MFRPARFHGLMLLLFGVALPFGCQKQEPPAAAYQASNAPLTEAEMALPVTPPEIVDGFVLRPTFHTTNDDVEAGTAFVATVAIPGVERPVILTALHLMGPNGGLEKQLSSAEVAEFVKSVSLVDAFGAPLKIEDSGPCIVVPQSGVDDEKAEAGDMLAFWAPQGLSEIAHPISVDPLREGETVWLAASVVGGAPPEQRLHPAKVVGLLPSGELVYQFENPNIELRATSGAPIVNERGAVVAINCGGANDPETNAVLGVGNPVGRFAFRLSLAAIKQKKQVAPAPAPESPTSESPVSELPAKP